MNTPTLPTQGTSFYHHTAGGSWKCGLIVFLLLVFGRRFTSGTIVIELVTVVGLILGIVAMFGIRKYGMRGILAPALVGIVINGVFGFGSVSRFLAERAREQAIAAIWELPGAAVSPDQSSTAPEYGYSVEKPIMVGSEDEGGGPIAERAYFSTLRDHAGKPVMFKRRGNFGSGPDGHIIDGYDIQLSTGEKILLYIDMYHPGNNPEQQLAPKGLFKAR